MPDRFLGERQFPERAIDDVPHDFLAVQHRPGLVVLLNEVLDLIQQLPVDLLVLGNQGQHLIDLHVEVFVLVQSRKVLLP